MHNDFLYQLSNNLEYEMLDTNDKYLKDIFKEAEKYYSLPYISNNIIIKQQLILGNFAFYLLDCSNLDFDTSTISQIQLINYFLSHCIKNNKYCDNKVFLSFVRDILNISNIPTGNVFTSNYYNKSNTFSDIELNERLNIIFNNVDDIKLNKTYICNGIIDLIVVSICEIFSQGYDIKRCRNCHKYFFNKNSNKYCPYTSPQDVNKSCYEYCSNTSSVQKRKNDPIQYRYNKISNMLRSRWTYHQRESDRKALSDFSDEYHSMIQSLNEGILSKEAILEFLNSHEKEFKTQYKKNGGKKKNGSSRNNKK